MKGLTERQRQVLEYIQTSVAETGYPPTIREIGLALDIRSTNGVNDHLKALERKGYIERDESKSRAILVVGTNAKADRAAAGRGPRILLEEDVLRVPLLGRIAAGNPIEAIEESSESVVLGADTFGRRVRGEVFALEIQGESMINDGIHDGDVVFVRRQPEVARGAIAAVYVDGSATVKRFYREGTRIRLQPANDAMSPIYLSGEAAREIHILGEVVGLLRRF